MLDRFDQWIAARFQACVNWADRHELEAGLVVIAVALLAGLLVYLSAQAECDAGRALCR